MNNLNLIAAWRNLKKNKVVSIINILGLTIGLTCAVFAIAFAYHELTFEDTHEKADRIARVYTYGNFGSLEKIPVAFGPTANDLQSQLPEVELAARTVSMSGIVFKEEIPYNEQNLIVAENTIFSILTIPFLQGTQPTGPNTIAISEKMARKYFGADDPINKTLDISIRGQKQTYTVTGVFKELPSNTHAKASIFLPFDLAYKIYMRPDEYESTEYAVYTLLTPGTNVPALNVKIAETVDIPVPIENVKYALVPIKRIHLYENIQNNALANFMMILIGGLVVLIITIFNYINTSTLMFSARMKEIGIRKTNGGSKNSIFVQFLADSGLSVTISLILAILLFLGLKPMFNQLLDTHIEASMNWVTLSILLGVFAFTVFLSGLYPAIKSLRVKTVSMIRDTSGSMFTKNRLSNTLVTMQFVIAILFLQFIIINQKQTQHMFAEDVIKYNGDNVICMDGEAWGNLNTIQQELLKSAAIQAVSWGQYLPAHNLSMTQGWKEEGNQEMANHIFVEDNYLDVFRIKMKEGRFFANEFTGDASQSVVINPITAVSLGYDDPVGKKVMVGGRQLTIIGVAENYLSVPPVFDRMPLLLQKAGNRAQYLLIRTNSKQQEMAHQHIQQVLHSANPNYPVEIKYYTDIMVENGKSFIASGIFINIFTGTVLFNAMMGLFGLSFFIAQKRNKEIGVRKVCGATFQNVLWSLSNSFMKKLLLAMIITFPLGYFIGSQYITTYTDQIQIGPGIFIMAAMLSLLMVVLSTGWKVVYTAMRNPVEALRYE